MKIKVSKTFQKVLALVLCTIMVFGAAPLASVLGIFTDASAEELYTITYYVYKEIDGESQLTSETVQYAEGEAIEKPENPTRIGHTFLDWYPAEIPDTMPAEDLSFTAQWQINQYTITFDTDGGNAIKAITQDYGTAINPVADPTKEGYTFTGWDNEIPKTMPAEDMTITASWDINAYTITFDTDGGTPVTAIKKDFFETIDRKEIGTTEKTGYNFMGWEPEVPTTMPAEDMTVTAQWELKTITLTFDTVGGTPITPITQKYNTTIVKPENPTKEGYTFKCWNPEIPDTMPAENTTYTAEWTPNTINVTFDPNGGTLVHNGNPTQNPIEISYEFGILEPVLPVPTKSGYTFMGWYESKDTDIEIGTSLAETGIPSEDKTYYAIWKEGTGKASYSITYHLMDVAGNYPTTTTVNYSAEDGQVIDITDEVNSKVSVGFKIDDSITKPEDLIGTASAEAHLSFNVYIARYEFTITLDPDNGSKEIEITDYYEAAINAPENPEKDGYTFKGWKNKSTGNVENLPASMPAANMSFIAQWEKNTDTKYSIVINYKDATKNGAAATKKYDFAGTTGNKIKILIDGSAANDGALYHKLADFTLEHYKFDISVMENQQLEGTIAADGTTVLNLFFAPVTYNVYFTVSGKTVATEEVTYYTDANVVKPTTSFMNDVFADMMPGYTFKGWEPALSYIEGDTTYVATYTANPYKITFDYDKAIIDEDGKIEVTNEDFLPKKLVDTIAQDFNTVVKIPAMPEKDGYTCLCWYDDDFNIYKPGSTIKMPVDGLFLTAYFVADPFTITFDANLEGATLKTKSATAPCDDFVEIAADMIPSKEGYTFLGWYDYTDEKNPKAYNLGDKVLVPANDLTLVAEWAVGEFAIIFKDNTDNGKIVATYEDIASDAKITAPDYPKASNLKGRTFLGWRAEGKEIGDPLFVFDKMPGHSMVLEAVWGYTITFDLNTNDSNAALTSAKTVTNEIGIATEMSQISNPTRTGYSFTGWYSTEDTEGKTPVGETASYAVDTTLYAGWSINSYTMTLIADDNNGTGKFADGTKRVVIAQNYNTEITAPQNPTKVGYTFAGWKDQNGKSYSAVPAKMPAKNLVLTAQWTINSYNVVFKDASGTIYKSEVLNYGSAITAPAAPSKIGCTFMGWDVTVPETVPAHDVVITAVWKENIYTITFLNSNGKVIDVVSGTYGSVVREVEEPSKCFYKFAGWDKEVPETMPAEDLVITATWERNTGFLDFFSSMFTSIFSFLNQIMGYINSALE